MGEAALPQGPTAAPLSKRLETTLNRDLSRRRAQISAATQTKGGWEKRRAACEECCEHLNKLAERAEQALTNGATKIATAQAKQQEEETALRKAQASADMMDRLLEQLHQRKAAILQERTAIIAEDEEQRSALSEQLRTKLDGARGTLAAKETDGSSNEKAADANPFAEHARLRTSLLDLAEEMEASEAAHAQLLGECAANTSTLELELEHVQEELAAAETESMQMKVQSDAISDAEAMINEQLKTFTAKFGGFNETSQASTGAFSARAQAFKESVELMRASELEVRKLKLVKSEHAKRLKALKEQVASKENELEQASAKTAKMRSLCDTLREEIELKPLGQCTT